MPVSGYCMSLHNNRGLPEIIQESSEELFTFAVCEMAGLSPFCVLLRHGISVHNLKLPLLLRDGIPWRQLPEATVPQGRRRSYGPLSGESQILSNSLTLDPLYPLNLALHPARMENVPLEASTSSAHPRMRPAHHALPQLLHPICSLTRSFKGGHHHVTKSASQSVSQLFVQQAAQLSPLESCLFLDIQSLERGDTLLSTHITHTPFLSSLLHFTSLSLSLSLSHSCLWTTNYLDDPFLSKPNSPPTLTTPLNISLSTLLKSKTVLTYMFTYCSLY
uniref:Uncharacterized protein n=1 Tax=Physcomitrium patens TaxID=3218 RepID=A0A2K1JMX5_PHYPA|nr:hypothetical protein PHYPA_017727 [Physcomitrium patens]